MEDDLFLTTVEGSCFSDFFMHKFIVEVIEVLTGDIDCKQLFEIVEL